MTTTTKPGDHTPPVIGTPSASAPGCVSSGSPVTVTVTVTVTDASPVTVTLISPSGGPTTMTKTSGSSYTGTFSVSAAGSVSYVIRAVDSAGNQTKPNAVGSVNVPSCATTTSSTTSTTTHPS